MSKLTEFDRNTIREMARDRIKYKDIAKQFGCSIPHVSSIVAGRIGATDKPNPEKPGLKPNTMPWITMGQLTARR